MSSQLAHEGVKNDYAKRNRRVQKEWNLVNKIDFMKVEKKLF